MTVASGCDGLSPAEAISIDVSPSQSNLIGFGIQIQKDMGAR